MVLVHTSRLVHLAKFRIRQGSEQLPGRWSLARLIGSEVFVIYSSLGHTFPLTLHRYGFLPRRTWGRDSLDPRPPHRLLLHPGQETQSRPSAISTRSKGISHNRQPVGHPKCLYLQAPPRNESRFGYVFMCWSLLFPADEPLAVDSDIIHLQVFGFHLIVCNSKGVADDLLDKRSSVYSDR